MSPHLTIISEPFLRSIDGVGETSEKATACKGFALCVIHNPQGMEKDLPRYFSMIAGYQEINIGTTKTPMLADLQQIFKHVSQPET
jgi:hypothetical protein